MRALRLLAISLSAATALAAAAPTLAQGPVIRPPSALISATDGRWLSAACNSQKPGDRSWCYGYIIGMSDQLSVSGVVCRPANVGGDQLVGVVRSHLAASPRDLQRHASFLVRRVLEAAYPCRL